MATATLQLNGKSVEFEPGQTILDVATESGVDIPTLCYLKGATPTGACRMCVVEVTGARALVAACTTPAAPNMEVWTDSERVRRARKLNIELLLASGHHDCLTCEANGNCRLQDLAYDYEVTHIPFPVTAQPYPKEDDNPFIIRDFSRCILCGRCVQACNEVVVNRAISYGYRGADSKIIAGTDQPYFESDCVFCGQCVEVCPVGALMEKKSRYQGRPWELKKVRTTCPYCGVGCQMWVHVNSAGRIARVTAVEDGAPNKGRLCVKGRFGYDFIYSEDRLTDPMIKKGGSFHKVSWDEALDFVAGKLTDIKDKYGPDAIAGVSCARSINEDSYQMQKFFRSVIETNNIDHCART